MALLNITNENNISSLQGIELKVQAIKPPF